MKRKLSDAATRHRPFDLVKDRLLESCLILFQLDQLVVASPVAEAHQVCAGRCRNLIRSLMKELEQHPDYIPTAHGSALKNPEVAKKALETYLPPELYDQWVGPGRGRHPPLIAITVVFQPSISVPGDDRHRPDVWLCELTFEKAAERDSQHHQDGETTSTKLSVDLSRDLMTHQISSLVSVTSNHCTLYGVYGENLPDMDQIQAQVMRRPKESPIDIWRRVQRSSNYHHGSAIVSFLFYAWIRCGAGSETMNWDVAFDRTGAGVSSRI